LAPSSLPPISAMGCLMTLSSLDLIFYFSALSTFAVR